MYVNIRFKSLISVAVCIIVNLNVEPLAFYYSLFKTDSCAVRIDARLDLVDKRWSRR